MFRRGRTGTTEELRIRLRRAKSKGQSSLNDYCPPPEPLISWTDIFAQAREERTKSEKAVGGYGNVDETVAAATEFDVHPVPTGRCRNSERIRPQREGTEERRIAFHWHPTADRRSIAATQHVIASMFKTW